MKEEINYTCANCKIEQIIPIKYYLFQKTKEIIKEIDEIVNNNIHLSSGTVLDKLYEWREQKLKSKGEIRK